VWHKVLPYLETLKIITIEIRKPQTLKIFSKHLKNVQKYVGHRLGDNKSGMPTCFHLLQLVKIFLENPFHYDSQDGYNEPLKVLVQKLIQMPTNMVNATSY